MQFCVAVLAAHRSSGIVASSSTTGTARPSWSSRCSSGRCGRCRRRPRARARFPAPNRTPSAALFLLRTLDNKFFENSTHARRACRSATSSRRRLRSARRRRSACRRTAGKSKEFRPRSRSRGDRQDTRRTVEEKSTRAIDRKNLPRANRRASRLPVSSAAAANSRSPCQKSSIACCHPAGPFCANPAAACASGAGAICWIKDRNPEKFGRSRKRSNSSRRGRSAEIFGESASAFWISA